MYELACMWLGEHYLDDPTAAILRDFMRDKNLPADISSKYDIRGEIPFLRGEPLLPFWTAEKSSLIGVGLRYPDCIGVYVRVLSVFDGLVGVTEHPDAYPDFDSGFVQIDALTGQRRISTFEAEVKRMVDLGEVR